MANFDTDEDQRDFRAHLRRFCEEKIAPRAAQIDREAKFSWDNFADCVSVELPALAIPAAYGGSGADEVTYAIAIEELARVCASTSLTMAISKLAMTPLLLAGSEELKRTYLPKIASGDSQGSYCMSEADAGSDVAAMRTLAVRDGDSYVISGTKYWITNAGISDLYTVFAKTDPHAGHRGITAFLVPADAGIKFGKMERKMGVRASPTGEVILDSVRIPASHRIGEEGEGFYIAMRTLDHSRPIIGAQAVGIAQGALDHAISHISNRRQFGHAVSDFQGLRFIVAEAAMKIEAARALVYKAASMAGQPHQKGDLAAIGAMAKCFASDVAMAVTTDAVQLAGGYGYSNDLPLERMMRDAKITQIYEGTNQIQRIVISKRMLG